MVGSKSHSLLFHCVTVYLFIYINNYITLSLLPSGIGPAYIYRVASEQRVEFLPVKNNAGVYIYI